MIIDKFIARSPIEKGWSSDKKYICTDADGNRYLLRTSSPDRAEKRRRAFLMMNEVAALGVKMPKPIEYGETDGLIYTVESYIEGGDAEDIIPTLPTSEQYRYGVVAGEYLRRIHSIPAPETNEAWQIRFGRKLERKLKMYAECPIKYEDGEVFVEFVKEKCHLITNRPQTYQHGDYHIGNMMVGCDGELFIIDFDRDDYGDPWEEFNRIVWCGQKAPIFASGMVDGYFGGDVPEEFWHLLALYISCNALSSLPWAVPFGDGEVDVMLKQAEEILEWYDGMRRVVPSWYRPIK